MMPMPQPPAGSPHRTGGMPPSLLGPSSSSAFPAAAAGDDAADGDEHAYVTLEEWWLATAEGDDQKRKIAVAGKMQKNQTLYTSAPIAKCYKPLLLKTEDRAVIRIHGAFSVLESYNNGYSPKDVSKFLYGFPDSWQSYKPQTNSHMECQPCSSNASNSGGDSTQFYLGMCDKGNYVMSRFDEFLKSYSHKDAVFQKSSHLLNGRPRIEEYIDGDITENENAAASSEAATGDQRTPVGSLEVHGCHKETQHMSLTEKEANNAVSELVHSTPVLGTGDQRTPVGSLEVHGCHKETQHMSLTEKAPNNAVSELVHSTPALGTDCKKTPVASLKSQGSWRENQHIASNKKPVGRPKKQISSHEKCRSATIFAGTRNPASYTEKAPNNAVSELVHSTPALGTDCKKTPVASLKSQGSWRENQHITSNKKPVAVGRPKKQISSHEKCRSATIFAGTRNPASYVLWSPLTRDKATALCMSTPEALNLKRSRSGRVIVPKLDNGCQSIVYRGDGSIAAVIGLYSPAVPKWSESKTDRRKKRKTKEASSTVQT